MENISHTSDPVDKMAKEDKAFWYNARADTGYAEFSASDTLWIEQRS